MSGLARALHDAFATHADASALTLGDTELRYDELGERAARFAAWLDDDPGPHVGLLVDRTLSSCVAVLGTVLAGRTPVPLPWTNPAAAARAARRLGLRRVVDCRPSSGDLADLGGLETLETVPFPELDDQPRAPTGRARGLGAQAGPAPDAYVLFTSGSTGEPKGVPITVEALLHYVAAARELYAVTPGARCSATFMLTFDVAMHDLFVSLLSGATLALPVGREYLFPAEYAERARLSHWFSVPSVVRIADRLDTLPAGCLERLEVSIFAGEALHRDDVRTWRRAAPHSRIHNLYGPTECTIGATQYRLPDDLDDLPDTANGTVPIGTAYPGLELHVGRPGRATSRGELHIRGPQRFDGYLGDTATRFVAPDGVAAGAEPPGPEAWYATGDLVEALPDGTLVFLGRGDRQVKLHGHRVELGEVEHLVRQVPGVGHAVAFTTPGEGDLVVVCEAPGAGPELVRTVVAALPTYLRSARCVLRGAFPLTSTGKTDVAAIRADVLG